MQQLLFQLRKTIKAAAPKATEVMSYQMSAYKQNGLLVFFAWYTKHIGFYPTDSGITPFKTEIEKYKWSKEQYNFQLTNRFRLNWLLEL